MMTDNVNTQKGKNNKKEGNEEEVSIEDLEKLIREGLNELEDSEAKKQLEKEFKEVVEATTAISSAETTPTIEEAATTTERVTPVTHEGNMVIREMQPDVEANEDNDVSHPTLPPGVVTFIANIEPETETSPTTVATTVITTPKVGCFHLSFV